MSASSKYKLLIAYDGTHYPGWQVQSNAISIQTLIQQALSTALHTPTDLTGSGRTDAGVHALQQVAHFISEETLDLCALKRSLNGLLPSDIRITHVESVEQTFHARYSAVGKIYRYHLDRGCVPDPFTRQYATHLSYPINIDLLKAAARACEGTHDFTSFSNESHRGSAANDPVRTLKKIDIIEEGDTLILEFEGNGFLYKMVRNLTGTMLDIARGKIPLDHLPAIFEAKDRRFAGACAPAKGLFLVKVIYA